MVSDLNSKIDTIAVNRFFNCIRGTGITTRFIAEIQDVVDELLLYKNDFEVLVVCGSVENKRVLSLGLTDIYKKYTNLVTIHDVLYQLSTFPILSERPYDVPSLPKIGYRNKKYEAYLIEPDCYIKLCKQQLEKLDKINDLCT